jgi:hypothetical protein
MSASRNQEGKEGEEENSLIKKKGEKSWEPYLSSF